MNGDVEGLANGSALHEEAAKPVQVFLTNDKIQRSTNDQRLKCFIYFFLLIYNQSYPAESS